MSLKYFKKHIAYLDTTISNLDTFLILNLMTFVGGNLKQ